MVFRNATIALLLLASCKHTAAGKDEEAPADVDSTDGALKVSAKGNVRFKRNERLANDLAQALGLSVTELCKEFDAYDCATDVHKVALGGVDPYAIGLYEPAPDTGASTTIAVDRVVLAACDKRAKGDFAAPAQAQVFIGLSAASTPDSAEASAAVTALYDRGLARAPTDAEREHLLQLFRDIAMTGTPAAAASWATLSCFAVLSSNEGLFY
jgi:hypothetical protein